MVDSKALADVLSGGDKLKSLTTVPYSHGSRKTCPCYIHRFFFSAIKTENFIGKKNDIFNINVQNIDCVYVRTALVRRF